MTDPEQVLVNVADLRAIKDWWYGTSNEDEPLPRDPETKHAFYAVFDAIPEPEWEPTDDLRAKYRRAYITSSAPSLDWAIDKHLLAMHREGLL